MTTQNSQPEKLIYIISDGIGQSAINLLKASMIQFDLPSSSLRVFSKVENKEKIRFVTL